MLHADIKQPFDCLHPKLLRTALLALGVHPRLIAALLFECCGNTFWPNFFGVELSTGIPFSRAVPQGGTESPQCWNIILAILVTALAVYWQEQSLGFNIDGAWITHYFWADNLVLVSGSQANIHLMLTQLTRRIREWGLDRKQGSLQILSPQLVHPM